MHLSTIFTTLALASGSLAGCGEPQKRICFGPDGGESQDVLEEDLRYAADVIRTWIKDPANDFENAFWTKPAGDLSCGEWEIEIPDAGTVMVLVSQTGGRYTSSVLLEDLARTIDGGLNPTATSLQSSLLGCGTDGGMIGVQWNSSNPIYKSAQYLATKAKPDNLIMKVVRGKDA